MKTGTLAIIVRDNKVALGRKKKGFAAGTINGPGGKMEEEDEGSPINCVCRETREEWKIELDVEELEQRARIIFHIAGTPAFDVAIFFAGRFSGELKETEETERPLWYELDEIPFVEMLESDRDWFKEVIAGRKFNANVYYRGEAKDFERIEFFEPDF